MKKKILSLLMVTLLFVTLLAGCNGGGTNSTSTPSTTPTTTGGEAKKELTFGVLVYKYDDTYISTVRAAIEKYAGESDVKIKLEMLDGKGDQATQNDQLDVLIEKKVDLILVNAVDAGSAQGLADKIKTAKIPAVFFNREPAKAVMESIDALFVGTTASEAGVMQGNILSSLWEKDKAKLDRNGDGKVQFLVFKGEPGNPEAEARTSFSISTMEDKGFKMEDLNGEAVVANWATDQAQEKMQALWAANGEKLEAVFCNNDDMALGVIAALNSAGYNKGNAEDPKKEKWIPVIGVDATDAGMQVLESGKLAGTVKQDGDAMGKALIEIGINAATGKDFVEGTSYKLADDGVSVRIPYAEMK